MPYFKDKNVLVTGGASGIGFAVCSRLVREGARVLLTDVDEEGASRAAAMLECSWKPLDVTDRMAFLECVVQFEKSSGPLDILFNNAGVVASGEAHLFEYDDWKRVIDINLYGVVNGVHTVYADMVERKSGQIVNIASIAGLYPSAGQASYSASKYAVVGLSHALRVEGAQYGVKVNVVCPGIIKTAMRDNLEIKGEIGDKVMEILPDGMDVDKCAKKLLKGVSQNQSTIVITPMARALWGLVRIHPDLSMWFGSRMVDWLKRE